MNRIPVAVSWSGGKDSALALQRVLDDEEYEVKALLSTVDMYRDRLQTHDVHRALIEEQARALELPLHIASMPGWPDNRTYEQAMGEALQKLKTEYSLRQIVFGDIFLEDVRAFRETQVEASGLEAAFPLWHQSTLGLANEFCERGFDGIVVCVDHERLDDRFCGRRMDRHFFRELPGGVDHCGENGEFHSFVTAAPSFAGEINVSPQPARREGNFVYCDLR
jgi:uncharacterized protein (TIGR00290 family)